MITREVGRLEAYNSDLERGYAEVFDVLRQSCIKHTVMEYEGKTIHHFVIEAVRLDEQDAA